MGDPQVVPQCTEQQFETTPKGKATLCPADSQIGVLSLTTTGPNPPAPIYNLVPPAGYPAEFGVKPLSSVPSIAEHILLSIRSDGDYGLNADISNLTTEEPVAAISTTLFGTPTEGSGAVPFLDFPPSCAADPSLTTTVATDSWGDPGCSRRPKRPRRGRRPAATNFPSPRRSA